MTGEQLKAVCAAAQAVKGWSNCNQAWLDTSEDDSVAVVGHIGEDGETYPVLTVDCDQYMRADQSMPLAKFYATANPATVSAMCDEIERLRTALRAALEAPAVEPYAWIVMGTSLFSFGPERPFDDDAWQPVFTAPQAQQEKS